MASNNQNVFSDRSQNNFYPIQTEMRSIDNKNNIYRLANNNCRKINEDNFLINNNIDDNYINNINIIKSNKVNDSEQNQISSSKNENFTLNQIIQTFKNEILLKDEEIDGYKEMGYSSEPMFIFGTNDTAKDYCKLMFTGMRLSFCIAIGVSLVNIIIGLIWGSISGYFGGWVDIVMERICDIISGLPSTVIITLCILYGREFNWGSAADVIALMVALFMTGWMGVSARTRTQFYRYKGREYVLASRTLGAKDGRLIFRHILPNASGTIITGSILMIPSVIYTEASIAYLGLGLQGQVLFGVILSEANSYYQGDKAFLLYIPTFVMMLLLVSFNLFGNGLRDAFNPALKGGKN